MLLLVGVSCAKVVTPVGGPKDDTPPKILKMQPASANTHYNGDPIKITFDEFVTLNNPNENVLISPPMAIAPDFNLNGKTLVIKFKDTLQPNTTYNMIFSNCVQDYHEGNKLNFFQYSFSTGDALDSFKLKGTLRNAQTLAPSGDFFVMLYKQNIDSLPLTVIPDYVTKSIGNGNFEFKHIAPGEYKIFALKDINSNLKFDLPNEEIAFAFNPVKSYLPPQIDTTDSTGATQRITLTDTMPDLYLYTFVEQDSLPKLMRYENPAAGIYQFPYKSAITQFESIALAHGLEHFEQINATRDTVTWYFKTPVTDTLTYLLTADGQSDTVQLKPFKKLGMSGGRGSQTNKQQLNISFANAGHRFNPLTLVFGYPVQPVDSFPIFVCTQRDTIITYCSVPDTFTLSLPLPLKFEDKKNYTVWIPDSIFKGYNGLSHDTLRTQFVCKSVKDYGNLIMHYDISENCGQIIAQLHKGGKLIQEDILTASQTITYENLPPDQYKISVIKDTNRNGRWDSGNYRKKLQPEEIIHFSTDITIRAFWDDEERMIIKD